MPPAAVSRSTIPFADVDLPVLLCLAVAVKDSAHDIAAVTAVEATAGAAPQLANYVEVRLLLALVRLRTASILFAEKPPTERNWKALHALLKTTQELLPDVVFVLLDDLLLRMIDAGNVSTHDTASGRLLEEIAEVCRRIEWEVLRGSHDLTKRCEHVTIHFENTFPFCVTH